MKSLASSDTNKPDSQPPKKANPSSAPKSAEEGEEEKYTQSLKRCAKAEGFLETIEGDLQCPICLELYAKSITLQDCGTCGAIWFQCLEITALKALKLRCRYRSASEGLCRRI